MGNGVEGMFGRFLHHIPDVSGAEMLTSFRRESPLPMAVVQNSARRGECRVSRVTGPSPKKGVAWLGDKELKVGKTLFLDGTIIVASWP
jgi:hypothetical protein